MSDPTPAFVPAVPMTTAAQDANLVAGMPAMGAGQTAAINRALDTARSLPGVVMALEATAPALATRLQTEEQSIHSSPLGGLLTASLTLVVTHYGLNWSPDFVGLVVAAAALVGGYFFPYIETLIRKA